MSESRITARHLKLTRDLVEIYAVEHAGDVMRAALKSGSRFVLFPPTEATIEKIAALIARELAPLDIAVAEREFQTQERLREDL